MFACASATLWWRSGGWAETSHCLHSAPWNVGEDFEQIKLCNETEANREGKPHPKYTGILIILRWESIYEKVKPKEWPSWGALHCRCIISWQWMFSESKVYTVAKYTNAGLVVAHFLCSSPFTLCTLPRPDRCWWKSPEAGVQPKGPGPGLQPPHMQTWQMVGLSPWGISVDD